MRAETPEFSLVLSSECKLPLYTVCVHVNGSAGPDTFGASDAYNKKIKSFQILLSLYFIFHKCKVLCAYICDRFNI